MQLGGRVELPRLVIVSRESGRPLCDLFGSRGFSIDLCPDAADLSLALNAAPAAAIVDFEVESASEAVQLLDGVRPRPAIVGIASKQGVATQELLDAAFVRPVDPARLFARVVQLVAIQRKGKGKRQNRLTGIVAVVDGNALFKRVEMALHGAVPPVNAGAILEKALRDLGTDPKTIQEVDLAAILASGRLEAALLPFGSPGAIRAALAQIRLLVERR